ncbi:DnaA ATPase domain-containing protein, partial [Moraxella caviae]
MSDFVQTAFNFDVRQDTDLSDFESAGFRPLMNAINEILSGNLRELFIVGRRGFGKTHLAMAMHRYLSAHKKTVINLSLNDLISSGADGSALLGLETFDVIIIDDFQAVTSSRAWQENLFDLINRVRDQKKQMVYLATAPAKE